MERVGRRILALALVGLVACASSEEGGNSLPPVSDKTKADVDEIMTHMNNESRTERWRKALIDVGREAPQNRKYIAALGRQELQRSIRRNGHGPGVLRFTGRQRVVQAVAQMGDDPDSRSLLKVALDDPVEDVRAAAAAGLASWGDASTIPTLVGLALNAKDAEVRKSSLQALRRLAKPAARDAFLNALTPEAQELLEPIVLRCFPEGPGRAPALRQVAGGTGSPYARAFALRVLTNMGDPQLKELAQAALDSGDPVLRPVALAALGSSGGSSAAEIEDELRGNPADPEAVVKGLYKAGSIEALNRAVSVYTDPDLAPATRAAVAHVFLTRVGHPKGPQAYRGDDAKRIAREALRSVLEHEQEGPVALASIEALGRVGDPAIDGEILLGLLSTPNEETGLALVKAMGHLGGELAAAKLVELIDVDPKLRAAAGQALGGFPDPRDVPMDQLIDLLDHSDVPAREAAIAALSGLNGGDAMGYHADGSDGERAASMDRWRSWWQAHSR